MGRSVIIFGSVSKSNFWRVFYVFLDLVIFAYFNAIFIDVYAVKSFIYIYFVLISMFLRWRILILKIQRLEELNDFYVFI